MTLQYDKHSLEEKAFLMLEYALELDIKDQAMFLSYACGEDTPLLKYCLSALDDKIDDDDFGRLLCGAKTFTRYHVDAAGDMLDGYVLARKIGEGGSADVWLAFRYDDFKLPVAIKIIRYELGVQALRELLRIEQKVLSQYSHTGIANFLGAGKTDDGRSYVVLEYVNGVSITKHCRTSASKLSQRLILFLDVCKTVSDIHDKHILHCDLKPSNILVTQQGGTKLLDFGSAKLADDTAIADVPTSLAFSPMTPQYASPEQIAQRPLSFASDQYSLGVVLYELVCGQLPHDTTENRLICAANSSENMPPSERIKETNGMFAQNNFKLFQVLSSGLDSVIMRAMSIDPDKRYESVKVFARALSSYL